MDESSTKPTPLRGPSLVEQDVELGREWRDGESRVVARVECVRRSCSTDVEQCARCAHFVRIEVHEAGYQLLCRARDEDAQRDEEEPEGPG